MKPVKLKGFMQLHVNIGDLEMPVWSGIVVEHAVGIMFGSIYINNYVRSILPFHAKQHCETRNVLTLARLDASAKRNELNRRE